MWRVNYGTNINGILIAKNRLFEILMTQVLNIVLNQKASGIFTHNIIIGNFIFDFRNRM